jgi:hypothetical protein
VYLWIGTGPVPNPKDVAMRYMLLIYASPETLPTSEAEGNAQFEAYGKYTQSALEAGVMEHGAPLQGNDTATTVRVRGGDTLTTDGPFAETKEHLLGYYLMDCKDLDDAISWAAKIPTAVSGSIEIRPIMEVPGM